VISQFIANRLNLKVGDAFNTFHEGEKGYNLRNFNIVGIFNSGFQEFDATFIIGDIRHMQRINGLQIK
jgi:lipoprotein-releasing system permease protein